MTDQTAVIVKAAVINQMKRALDNLKFKQTSKAGEPPQGFAYAEVPIGSSSSGSMRF